MNVFAFGFEIQKIMFIVKLLTGLRSAIAYRRAELDFFKRKYYD